jgi:hypothetical protein
LRAPRKLGARPRTRERIARELIAKETLDRVEIDGLLGESRRKAG